MAKIMIKIPSTAMELKILLQPSSLYRDFNFGSSPDGEFFGRPGGLEGTRRASRKAISDSNKAPIPDAGQ